MSQSTPVQIRLAPADQPGAAIYNAYHYLTQISGFYILAAQAEPDPAKAERWSAMQDSVLSDVGEVYKAWDTLRRLPAAPAPTPLTADARQLGERIARNCRRINVFSVQFNNWTPMERFARVAGLCELHWLRMVAGIESSTPSLAPLLTPVATSATVREAELAALSAEYTGERNQAEACFGVLSKLRGLNVKTVA